MQDTLGVDAPQRSVVLAQRAWALSAAGRTDEARTWYDLAVYKLRQEAGPVHPYVITLELARAQHLLAAGLRHEAEGALRRALSEQREVLRAVGVTSAPWSPAEPLLDERTNRIDEDADGDWLLDVFERAARLDPTRADTDGDGVTDDEGDADGDGIPNGLAWPYGADPRKVVGHFGAVDPDRFGFRRERAFVARRVAPGGTIGAAWQVDAEPMGFYFARLTSAQKAAAFTRGFRLRARMALWEGNAFVNLDLVPVASRFDLNAFIQPPSRASVILMTSSMPRAGEWVDHGERGALPLIEFAFDPRAGTARYLVDGRTVRTDYAGYRQYQEDFGVFWGTTNDVGTAPRGLADFSLAWLTIR